MPNQFGPTYAAGNAASSHNAMRHGLTIPFDTFRHFSTRHPNKINALRNEIPRRANAPPSAAPPDQLQTVVPVFSMKCETNCLPTARL
jgi:hypothetical protein